VGVKEGMRGAEAAAIGGSHDLMEVFNAVSNGRPGQDNGTERVELLYVLCRPRFPILEP
jgi:hypothetical protein